MTFYILCILKINNNFTTIWNKMKHDSTVFLIGYIICAPKQFGNKSLYQQKKLITATLCISKNEAQYVYAYDNSLKLRIFKEKQTETLNCLFHL